MPPTRNSDTTIIIKSQEKMKLKPALLKDVQIKRWIKCNGMGMVHSEIGSLHLAHSNLVRVKELSCSTHIMKKMPPQSAVQERLVGSSCVCRPIGPSRRPRKLHTTTRRTTKHTAKVTLHLKEDIYRHFKHTVHLIASEGVASQTHHLILSMLLTSGVYLMMSLCIF